MKTNLLFVALSATLCLSGCMLPWFNMGTQLAIVFETKETVSNRSFWSAVEELDVSLNRKEVSAVQAVEVLEPALCELLCTYTEMIGTTHYGDSGFREIEIDSCELMLVSDDDLILVWDGGFDTGQLGDTGGESVPWRDQVAAVIECAGVVPEFSHL